MLPEIKKPTVWDVISNIPRYLLDSVVLSARRLFSRKRTELTEELYATDWKDYYQILQLNVTARKNNINAAYIRLVHTYSTAISKYPGESIFYAGLIEELEEAFQVISNRERRRVYDQLYWARLKANFSKDPITKEIVQVSGLVDKYVSERKAAVNYEIFKASSTAGRVLFITISACLLFLLTGTSIAIASPSSPAARTFKIPALLVLNVSSSSLSIIADARDVTARYERNIIQTSINAMRVGERIPALAPVTIPTNDMTVFPSPAHPLFPQYLDRQYSQFRYTLDEYGNIKVDTTIATTDSLLERIEKTIIQLEMD